MLPKIGLVHNKKTSEKIEFDFWLKLVKKCDIHYYLRIDKKIIQVR